MSYITGKVYSTPNIVFNGVKCLVCGELIQSRSVNDYVTCSCKNVSVDGGNVYSHISAQNVDKAEQFVLYEDDDFEKLRIYVKWGSYGASGKEPLERIPIALLTDSHIDAIIQHHTRISGHNATLALIEKEKLYRKMNKDEIQSSI